MKIKNRMIAGAAAVFMMTAAVVGGVAAPASAGTYTKTYYASSGTASGGLMCGVLLGQAAAHLKKLGFVITSSTCDAVNRKITVKYTEARGA